MKRSLRNAGLHGLVLGLYALFAVVMTWPVLRTLGTHVPGSYTWAFDEYTFLWNSWWLRYSLFDLGQNPLYATHTFYPLGVSLALYTFNLFNSLLSIPLQPYLSLPAISNLTFIAATVLSGYGTFLLVGYLLREDLPLPAGEGSVTPQLCGLSCASGTAGQAQGGRDTRPAGGGGGSVTDTRPAGGDTRPAGDRLVDVAAFAAGLIYALGSYRMVYAAIGHYNLASTAWIPFYTLYLLRTIRLPGRRNAALAGVFLVLALLCDMMLGEFLGLLTVLVLAFSVGKQGRTRVAGGLRALLGRLAVLGGLVVVVYSPVWVPVLGEMVRGYDLPGWGDAQKLSADLAGLVTPTALHPLGGDWEETLKATLEGTGRFSDVNTVFLGWTTLALAVVGAVRYRRQVAMWITGVVAFVVLSLGPVLQINGRSVFDLDGLSVSVPLPFILLHYLPVIKANRVPNRFSVVLMLALAVLAGFGLFWLLAKAAGSRSKAWRWLGVPVGLVLIAGLAFDHWSVPLPLTDARIPPAYETIAADPGDFAVLQLPMGWRNSFGVQGAESTQTQYFQSYHHKRLLSGNTSRNPPFTFDYFRGVPILESLIALETYGEVDQARRAADRATAAEFVDFYDLRYVVAAPGTAGRPPYVDTREAAVDYIEEVLPVDKVYDRDGWLVYEVVQPTPPVTGSVDFGSGEPLEAMALGEGWGEAEEMQGASARWAVEQGARAFWPADGEGGYRLSLRAMPFDFPGAGPQSVTPRVNGQRLEPRVLEPCCAWGDYSWEVPASVLREGLQEVRLEFGRLDAPADVLPGDGAIGQTGVQAPVAIEVNSGGPEGFAYITIGDAASGEAVDGSRHGAGYNLAAIDAKDGRLLDSASFDLTPTGSEGEAADLVAWMAGVPQGAIVAAALQGCETPYLSAEAAAALAAVGASATAGPGADCSHAVIGVQGAAPGTALEASAPGNSWLRAAPDRRTLALAVDGMTWERMK